ncbi:hypothetical protein BLA29_005988 [Euroglyphus maynei]|uniref:Uncharacterized protein n=1 Tax=Euroglyphus maynei TaxID=6958 RepID=A0A1Y3AWN9_EURMA|nr:hypothetical protein BLA29_005988 [Euroglyphus maynei]
MKEIQRNISPKCQKAMAKKFYKCSKRFDEEVKNIDLINNDVNSLITSDSKYSRRWQACCIIYRHHKCIKQAIELNSFYSFMLCNDIDVTMAESILDQTEQHRITDGFCPTSEHVEFQLCDQEANNFFGHNTMTTIVLLLGAMALSMAFLLTGYIVFNIQQQHRRQLAMAKFQLLEPLEVEMISTNQLN